jgi:AAHS family 4-hydroxybenzoate transporter-like MFS transporter
VLLSLIDGYDIAAIAFAAPHLVREWGLKPGQLGPVFSASLVGLLFGSALFGWIGDRYGRKIALISSNLLFGVFTFAAAHATNLEQLSWLRLLAGLGIGGVIPNIVAINTESAPRKFKATLALIAVGFVPIGGAIPGVVAATLVPTHGWQILFTIGGIVPIVLAVIGLFTLPESIKFMALHESQRAKMEKTLAALDPGFKVPPNATFIIEDEQQFPGFNPVYLVRQGLHLITPLLWLLFALNLMGYFFLLSWTPTLMAMLKLPPSVGALAGAMIQIGGTVGSLALARWFERQRFFAIAIVFVVAVPAVARSASRPASTSPVRWSIRPRCAPTARAGSLASDASARSSGRWLARYSSACRSRSSICGRRCRLRSARWSASPSGSSTRRACGSIRSCRPHRRRGKRQNGS